MDVDGKLLLGIATQVRTHIERRDRSLDWRRSHRGRSARSARTRTRIARFSSAVASSSTRRAAAGAAPRPCPPPPGRLVGSGGVAGPVGLDGKGGGAGDDEGDDVDGELECSAGEVVEFAVGGG